MVNCHKADWHQVSTFITTTTELWTDHDQMHISAACLGTEWYMYIYIWLSGESDRHPLGSPAVSVTWIFYLASEVIQARYACCVNHTETQQHSCRDSRSGCLDIYVLSIHSCYCSLNNSRKNTLGASYGVSFVSAKIDQSFAMATVALCALSCCIWPRYIESLQ